MTRQASDSNDHGGERAGTLTARAIADLTGGKLSGDERIEIDSVAPLGRATRNQLSFLGDGRYAPAFETSSAGVVLITPELAESAGSVPARVVVAKPQEAMLQLLPKLYPVANRNPSIDSTARIGRGARIGSGVTLEAYAVVGDGAIIEDGAWIGASSTIGAGVRIGATSRVFPNVTVYSGSQVGERVILHSGSRIGSDGFGYVFSEGAHQKIPHVGRCILENDVEIGANTTIDRGSIDDTVIGSGTKIDNLVQVGHNVKVGKLCLIMAQAGIAGSTTIGDGCVLAGQAGLGGHINIGAGAKIAAQAGVFGSVPAGETWSGYPARPHRESLRATGALFKLAEIIKDLEKLIEQRTTK